MTTSQRTRVLVGLLLFGLVLSLPQASYAVSGCTNAYLTGTYNAQVSSINLLNVLNTLNAAAGGSGSASGSTSTGGTTGSAVAPSPGFFGPGAASVAPTAGATTSGGTTGSVRSE